MGPVLVVGGCGSLGHRVVQQLIDDHWAEDVTVLDVRVEHNRVPGVKYIQGDLSSQEEVTQAINKVKPHVTIHTASPRILEVGDLTVFDRVNVNGTRFIIEALHKLPFAKVLVYTSSSSVIHDNFTDLIKATEAIPLCFEPVQQEHYTHTKAVAEKLVLEANGKHGLATAAIRACAMFGEGDTGMTMTMLESGIAGKAKFQIGNGLNLYDFTYGGNTAYAHLLAMKALLQEQSLNLKIPYDEKVNGEAFVVTNDDPWPFWDLPRAFAAAAGHPVKKQEIWQIPLAVYVVIAFVAEWTVWMASLGRARSEKMNRKVARYITMTRTFDISKAKKRLGYKPLVSMQEGIERSARWYLNRPK